MGEHLNQRDALGRLLLKVMVANRTREIRPSGMTTEALGNVGHGGIVTPPATERAGLGTLHLPLSAPEIYPNIKSGRQGRRLEGFQAPFVGSRVPLKV